MTPAQSATAGSTSAVQDDRVKTQTGRDRSRCYEMVLSTITDFTSLYDVDGRLLFMNKSMLDLLGLPLEQAVGKNFFELKYPHDLASKLHAQIQQVVKTRTRVTDEAEFTSSAGVTGTYEYIFSPVISADQTVEAVAGSTREITERRRTEERARNAEAALRENASRFRELADAMPQIVWAAQPDGTLDYYNRRWFEFIDLPPESFDDARWDLYIHPDDLARAYASWTASLQSGDSYSIEFRVRGADNRYRWFLARALPIRNQQNQITRWFGTCTDIQAQKAFQDERESLLESERQARSDAERASRMKDEFLATLSHEIRTPLNAILGWSQIIRQSNDPEDLAQGIEVIERNARSQSQIIEDLLDMSRIISGKVRLDVQRLDLTSIVNAAIATALPAAEAKGIRLQSVLDPLHGVVVSGDANRMQQVLWNLLSNAVKFTPKGGRVQVLLERVNSHLEINVVDSGEGIKPEVLPHVFDRFHQADSSTTRRHGGLGLGLSIVKHLAELHGGSVRASSTGAGQGATFTVELPLIVLRPEPESAEERRHPRAAPEFAGVRDTCADIDGLRVLVVDDEADARALVRRLLEECRAIVTTAGSVAEAVRLFQGTKFDVLVSDIGMPGTDGYSFIKQIRSMDKAKGGDIPAIALTAYARAEDRVKAVAAGFNMHVAKPVEPVELITMVAGAAGRTGR